jgi:hypothetical protein
MKRNKSLVDKIKEKLFLAWCHTLGIGIFLFALWLTGSVLGACLLLFFLAWMVEP